jgi:hypothetical protein
MVVIKTDLLVKPSVVTEDYCIEIFNAGKSLQGYALFLAKEEVHKHNQTGWGKFCEKLGLSERHAYNLIDFYEAKNSEAGDRIPDSASNYAELRGETPADKAQNYAEIKKSTGKENPTRQDIRSHNSMVKAISTTIQADMKADSEFRSWLDSQPGWENNRALKAYSSFSTEMLTSIPTQVANVFNHSPQWKAVYRKLAKVLHPDTGGTAEGMQLLTALDALMSIGVALHEAPMIKQEIEEMRDKYNGA